MAAALTSVLVSGSCGPLFFEVLAEDGALASVAQSYLDLYSRRWPDAEHGVSVVMRRAQPDTRSDGSFLSAAHMSVQRSGNRYLADTQYGFVARGDVGGVRDIWDITVPFDTVFGEPQIGDMEDIFSLISTAGWRQCGWTAVHAGAVAKNGTCAILCAASGGGKSTLTTALIRNGWRTLGDDKLLLKRQDGAPFLRALLQTFNLDPATSRWFDLGDLQALPRYSAWTEKRRVPLDAISPGSALAGAAPTHLVRITRSSRLSGVRAAALPPGEVLPALLRQIVLPADREVAGAILREAAACAARLRGVHLEIGHDAYAQPDWLRHIEEALL